MVGAGERVQQAGNESRDGTPDGAAQTCGTERHLLGRRRVMVYLRCCISVVTSHKGSKSQFHEVNLKIREGSDQLTCLRR